MFWEHARKGVYVTCYQKQKFVYYVPRRSKGAKNRYFIASCDRKDVWYRYLYVMYPKHCMLLNQEYRVVCKYTIILCKTRANYGPEILSDLKIHPMTETISGRLFISLFLFFSQSNPIEKIFSEDDRCCMVPIGQ